MQQKQRNFYMLWRSLVRRESTKFHFHGSNTEVQALDTGSDISLKYWWFCQQPTYFPNKLSHVCLLERDRGGKEGERKRKREGGRGKRGSRRWKDIFMVKMSAWKHKERKKIPKLKTQCEQPFLTASILVSKSGFKNYNRSTGCLPLWRLP